MLSDTFYWSIAIIATAFFIFLSVCTLAIAWASKKHEKEA